MNSYYGWRIAWALAITQTIGYGILYYGFGVFIKPMEAEFGWSRAETSGVFSLALLVAGLCAIPVGRFVDRNGARRLMTLGSSLGALLVLAWAHIQSLGALYALGFGLGLAMSAVLYEVAFTVTAVWFRRHRPRAMLLITLVAGLASTIFIPLETWLVQAYGWRNALVVLSLILAVGTVPLHALVLRRRPQDLGLEPDGLPPSETHPRPEPSIRTRAAIRMSTFWWLVTAVALARIAASTLGAHLVPLLLERGYTPALVATAAGLVGAMQLVGRLFFTPMTTRNSLHKLATATFAVHTLGLASLLLLPGALGVWLFVLLFGASNGAITLARAALLAETFGSAHYGQLNGVVSSITALTSALAPLIAGVLHQVSGGYSLVLGFLILTTAVSTLAVFRVQPIPEDYANAHS